MDMQKRINTTNAVKVVDKSPKNERFPKGVFTLISSDKLVLVTLSLTKYLTTGMLSILTPQMINKNISGTPKNPTVKGSKKMPCSILKSSFTKEVSPLNSFVYSENVNIGLI